ncbi:MAG: DNA primase [Patescibacteria group bacterium]|jgi:DNA primase
MDEISEIEQMIDVVDLIGGYVGLKKSGRNYKGLCPFHSEKTPSFMVSQELQIFKCFGCGESGDIFSFLQKIEGITFPQALEQLAEKAGVVLQNVQIDKDSSQKKIIYEINHLATSFYQYILLKHPAGKKATEYVKEKRGLKLDTIREFKIGYAPDSWDLLYKFLKKRKYSDQDLIMSGVVVPRKSGDGCIDKFRGRVMFPFVDLDGKVVGFSGRTIFDRDTKYLNTAETLVFHKSRYLFGLDKARVNLKKEGAVFVEGQMDVISAYQAGIKNIIASSGTSLTNDQLNIVSRYTKDVTFCFDSDVAGITAIARAIELADRMDFNVRVAMIPSDYKDIDELIKKEGKDAKSMLNNSVPVYDFFLVKALKSYDRRDPIGKKKIVEELVPIFSKISSDVILSHYVETLAKEAQVSEDLIMSLVKKKANINDFSEFRGNKAEGTEKSFSKTSIESYFLAMIFKADVDTAENFLYKLAREDFSETSTQEVFTELKRYIKEKGAFDIAGFIDTIKSDLEVPVRELYMWDIGTLTEDPKKFGTELGSAVSRIKKASAKRKITELTERLKLAEVEKNVKEIKELTEELKKYSSKLI